MMSAKLHTPGPWTVVRGDWAESGNVRYELDEIIVLRSADVRLIAAAPDLLAALRDLMGDHGGSIGVSRTDGRALAALAAIAKATGAQS
jgi:hypothetical protein